MTAVSTNQDVSILLRPGGDSDVDREAQARLRSEGEAAPYNWFGPPVNDVAAALNANHILVELTSGPDSGAVIGSLSWHPVAYGPNPESMCFSIGITLLAEYRGRGIGATAQRMLAEYLFDTTSVNRVEAGTDVTNIAEQRSLERAGFTREGTARGAQFRAGRYHDIIIYSRLRR